MSLYYLIVTTRFYDVGKFVHWTLGFTARHVKYPNVGAAHS